MISPLLWLACHAGPPTKTIPRDSPTPEESPPDSPSDDSSPDDSPADDTSPDDSPADDSSAAWTLPERPDTDHPTAADVWRWGGGRNYPDTVDPSWPVVTRVSDLAGLSAALASAVAGDIVYVDDDAEIDLTGQSLCLNAGVWLAGGRGRTDGGLLYSTAGSANPVLKACGDGVRITGLRIRGPDPDTCPPEWPNDCPNDVSGDSNCAYCTTTAYGIGTTGYDNLEVDNNELSGWTYTAVGVRNATGADVHHNHIHHDWREGLGYGVVLYGDQPTSALVRWNRFDAMRHAVAGQGYPSESYEARDNLMGPSAIGHIFDMHGVNEATGSGDSWAGDDIRIHRNIVLADDVYSAVIRGKPYTGAWIYDNCLAPSRTDATLQRYFTGHFYVDQDPSGASDANDYAQSPSDCGTLRWCMVDGGEGPLRLGSASGTPVSELLVGDLDGDGRDDVFNSTGSAWRYANPDGGSWTSLASSGVSLDQLALVDLDGDGRDDVFRASGSEWSWSRSGTSSWATLKSSSYGLDSVGFGDFNGDGAMDVFTTDGSRWSYHPNGSGAAVSLASAGVSIADLAFGDFDGDGVSDVFYADGSRWRWSRSGSASWADLASSSLRRSNLAFADVDGDGRTDVLSVSNEVLRYSSGGATSWRTLRYQRETLSELLLGDFDGDSRADLFMSGCL